MSPPPLRARRPCPSLPQFKKEHDDWCKDNPKVVVAMDSPDYPKGWGVTYPAMAAWWAAVTKFQAHQAATWCANHLAFASSESSSCDENAIATSDSSLGGDGEAPKVCADACDAVCAPACTLQCPVTGAQVPPLAQAKAPRTRASAKKAMTKSSGRVSLAVTQKELAAQSGLASLGVLC